MPSTFLTFKEHERLTCFPDETPQWDLITYFTLIETDGSLLGTYQGASNRLGAALQLCAVRYFGFCPADLHTASSDVITFLASQLQVDSGTLQDYGKRRMTRSTHFHAVLQHLGFRRVQPDDQEPIVAWLTERALEHDKPTLLFHMICKRLKQQQMIRPAVTTVERHGIGAMARYRPRMANVFRCEVRCAMPARSHDTLATAKALPSTVGAVINSPNMAPK